MFWVTDNFLMHRSSASKSRKSKGDRGLLHRVKIKYRSIRSKEKNRDSESDILLSGDEELLDSEEILNDIVHRPTSNKILVA